MPLASGITTNTSTGERHIPSSVRADGSLRREIRVRPGYCPPEDVQAYKNRSAAAWKNRGKGGVPGAEPVNDKTASIATSNKNAKKKEAKKQAKDAEETVGTVESSGPAGGGIGRAPALDKDNWRSGSMQEPVNPEVETEKKARNLKKRLKQARELREKKDKGESLLPEQLEKIIKINELVRQLGSLGIDCEDDIEAKQNTEE